MIERVCVTKNTIPSLPRTLWPLPIKHVLTNLTTYYSVHDGCGTIHLGAKWRKCCMGILPVPSWSFGLGHSSGWCPGPGSQLKTLVRRQRRRCWSPQMPCYRPLCQSPPAGGHGTCEWEPGAEHWQTVAASWPGRASTKEKERKCVRWQGLQLL